MNAPAWNPAIEFMEREALERLQLAYLRNTIAWALKTPFYKRRLTGIGLSHPEDIASLRDVRRLPYTTKDDLRDAYPEGLLAVDREEVVRLHTSSGTTGAPTVIYHTQHDIDGWTELVARCIVATGATRCDVFQNMTNYGLFTGGLGLHYGAERVGMLVIPASSGNTSRQIQLMRNFRTTVVHATPSYLLHLQAALAGEGVTVAELALQKAFIGAEPHSEETRRKIEGLLGVKAYNSYGLSEMNGPGVAFECLHQTGLHLWEDAYILEIIDPETLQPLAEGQTGEIVLTPLQRQATPLLRYRTRDLSHLVSGHCPCGRVHRRLARLQGRSDDLLIINGVNVFPSQIESALMKMPGVGTNYLIQLEKRGSLDRLLIKTEVDATLSAGPPRALDELREHIGEVLRSAILVKPAVELHPPGSLPVSEGKAKRVLDLRPAF
ncbi:MAG: phenylacetate--CoA ligase [Candidatus Competibacteraceae bacterium]|nr:phenylacetate--CoA ligase [Candidatus Competibacteraceae bacterium]MCP5126477.1 phenylacetate--CoA ligase [Gammaproteobacteria bacterium]HRX71661.1 phenylacetate--CoA ligase [Candidatus Competibacteraceae bacterium]